MNSEVRLWCTPGFKVQEIVLEGCGFCGTQIMLGITVTTVEKKVEPLGTPPWPAWHYLRSILQAQHKASLGQNRCRTEFLSRQDLERW